MQASYIPMKNSGKRQEKPEPKPKSKDRKPDWSTQRVNKRNYD